MIPRTFFRRMAATAQANANAPAMTRRMSAMAAVRPAVASGVSAAAAGLPRGWMSLAVAGGAALLAAYGLQNTAEAAPAANGLDNKEFVPLKLIKRERYNHDTDVYTFALPVEDAELALPVSSCVMTKFVGADGKPVVRPYTPIHFHEKGTLTLLVKHYPTGVMSQHINGLKPGDSLDIKGPFPKLKYEANKWKEIGMVVGGTGQEQQHTQDNSSGITPCLQVLHAIISNPDDQTKVHILYANKTPHDILMRRRLDALPMLTGGKVKVTHIVSSADNVHWNGLTGLVNKELIAETMPKPADDVMVYTCGPPGFMELVSGNKAKDFSQGEVSGVLKDLGFNKNNVYKF